MPLLHILGGSPWQTPTVVRARELGYRVLVTDMYAQRPAYAVADLHEQVDITQLDATLEVARRHRVSGILCDTTDVGVPTAAYVAERLGLPGIGYETALNFTNKARMRACTRRAGWSLPRFACVRSLEQFEAAASELGGTLVVKPVDNQSGRGVAIVRQGQNRAEAFARAHHFSRSGEVIVEECIEGAEIIVDGFVTAGRADVLAIADKPPYADNPTIARRIVYRSGEAFTAMADDIGPLLQSLIEEMGLRRGIFHAEFIIHEGMPVPIDIAARGGGVAIYTHVLQHVSGVDVMAAMIRLAMGEPVTLSPMANRRGASIDFFRLPAGVFEAMNGVPEVKALPGIAAVHLNILPGGTVGALLQKDDRPGFVVALADTSAEAVARGQAAKSLLRGVMNGGELVSLMDR